MIVGSIKNIDIDFSGDNKVIEEYGLENIRSFIENSLNKYTTADEIFDVLVYCKAFDKSKKPTVFSSITINTTFGPISSYGIDYNVKHALKTAMKNAMVEVEGMAENELYGNYINMEGITQI